MADFDPATMASSLATAYTQSAQDLLTAQSKAAQATSTALTKLQSALSTFASALSSLSAKKGLTQYSATLSSSVGTAIASATATPGNYSFFVEQVATAHQVAFEDLPAVPVSMGGPIAVKLNDGSTINLNLVAADADGDGTISQAEIARAINQSSDNKGKVTAMVMTVGDKTQLVLSSTSTGEAGTLSLDVSGLPAGSLKDALSAPKTLTAAKDAVVWLGDQGTGTRIQQASNALTAIPGVTVNFTRAQSTGDSPVTLSIASDDSGTASNVRAFVDAYNTLEKALDDLTSTGDASNGVSAAAFASDSGVRAMRNKLSALLRQDFGGVRLLDYGVSVSRDGSLSLDSTKLAKAVAANPDGLSKIFGSTSTANRSGLLGALDAYADLWTDTSSGQIKRRQETLAKQQTSITSRQTRLDDRFNAAYTRYLAQFTQLQTLQQQMSQTTSIFDSISTS
ncbi:flagellar filament capping protein FliD [Uliginosibacterium sp. sgz301328]|uniref:flagellar filament capping protein FliD n=1 Tax=Uliginosibacterium sp. sgz301328 TaxID=3243764 RepID=UPI00359ECBDB